LLHRYGSVAETLALRLLALSDGDRLQSVGALAAEFGIGRGTVQSALAILLREGALEVESRGRHGSFVTHLDTRKLLALAGVSPIVGVMPVPYSLRLQGLAAGLSHGFELGALPMLMAHMRGGRNRLHFLDTRRCDFAVISRLAWAEEGRDDLRLVLAFGPGSSVGSHVLLLASAAQTGIRDGMRVGVDPSSHDHLRLTLEECQGKAVQLVEISYSQAAPKLLAREIDAALWDEGVALPERTALTMAPLQHRLPGAELDTEAVLVTRTDTGPLGDLIARRLSVQVVSEIQRQVLAGEALPVF